jgi:hypothetical protein
MIDLRKDVIVLESQTSELVAIIKRFENYLGVLLDVLIVVAIPYRGAKETESTLPDIRH